MHLFSGFQFRDWLLANDPALSRLRMGLRVTLTIVLSFLILLAIKTLILPLPTAAFGLGIVLSIEGGVAVRDKGNSRQLITRLFGCVASLAATFCVEQTITSRAQPSIGSGRAKHKTGVAGSPCKS